MRRPGADLGLIIRACLALLLMGAAASAFIAFFAVNFGFPVGALVLLVAIGAAVHLLSAQGNVLRQIGVNRPERDDRLPILAGRLAPWLLPALFPMLAWLIWSRTSEVLPAVVLYTFVILALEAIFYYVRGRYRSSERKLALTTIRSGAAADALARVCQLAGTPVPKLLLLDSAAPDAFSLGLGPAGGEIVVTRGLLQSRLTNEELQAVLAHELCHLIHHDTTVLLAAEGAGSWPGALGSVFSVLTAAAGLITLPYLASQGLSANVWGGIFFTGVFLFLAALGRGTWMISYLVTRALTRYREYSADDGSAVITGDPAQLAGALVKISQALKNTSPPDLRRLRAAGALMLLETIEPRHRSRRVGSTVGSILFRWKGWLTSGHPPVTSRVARLRAMIE